MGPAYRQAGTRRGGAAGQEARRSGDAAGRSTCSAQRSACRRRSAIDRPRRRSGRSSSSRCTSIGTVGQSPARDGRAHRQEQHGQHPVAAVQRPALPHAGSSHAGDVLLQELGAASDVGVAGAGIGRGRGSTRGSRTHAGLHRPPRCCSPCFTVWAISVLSFIIIQLPPGDYVDAYIAQMSASGSVGLRRRRRRTLRDQYGLDQPIYVQYVKWMRLHRCQGNFGMSMEWRRPVTEVIGDRLWLTMVVSVAALIFTWVLALPIGIYSAVRPVLGRRLRRSPSSASSGWRSRTSCSR